MVGPWLDSPVAAGPQLERNNYDESMSNMQKKFTITKWQKSKVYCQDICKPGFKPNAGKPKTGRPKREI
jgi:hypothetical protein